MTSSPNKNNKGVVMRSTGSWYTVAGPDGNKLDCRLKGRFRIKGSSATNPIAVGDRVEYELMEKDGTGVITNILERDNYIVRKAKKLSKSTHVIAANIDQLILVITLAMPRTLQGFIDRVLVTAEAYHIPAVLVFNKTDLYDEDLLNVMIELERVYSEAEYQCLRTSAETGEGLQEFQDVLQDRVSLITGNSGVGKSTLINRLEPGLDLKVKEISTYHEKGMHATTFAEMHALSFGGYIIDTPGIREFGLIDFDRGEVAERFPEMRRYMHHCKYGNCTHTQEPGCAVKEALENGQISPKRYDSYLRIFYNDEWEEEKSF
jgi:ribosome biogenesis GTPase